MLALVKRLWKEEDGQGMVEYGLILALVAIVAIIGLRALGYSLAGEDGQGGIFGAVTDELNQATTPEQG